MGTSCLQSPLRVYTIQQALDAHGTHDTQAQPMEHFKVSSMEAENYWLIPAKGYIIQLLQEEVGTEEASHQFMLGSSMIKAKY